MHQRTLDAITTCTRTLGQTPSVDGWLSEAGVASLGPLRAAADRYALRERFGNAAIEGRWRPVAGDAAALFDLLLQARLDAMGSCWLAGIARNLVSHPGPDEGGLRWLAFEAFSGMPGPAERNEAVSQARAALPPALTVELRGLAERLADLDGFAAAAAAWASQASGAGMAGRAGEVTRGFRIPERQGDDARRGRFALPGRTAARTAATPAESDGQGAARASRDPIVALRGYRIFTTEFDRVVQAAALATRDELAALRAQLDADFGPMRSLVSRLSKRLMRVLMARQAREWVFDQDDGLLDQSRLPALIASRGAVRPFKREVESPFPSTAVTLLIDHSGSMKGRPMRIAALTVEIFVRILERCGVTCEVLGFTTAEWDGGAPGRLWAERGYAPEPGRLNALEHIVIKAADRPWRRERAGLGLSMRDDMLKENIDGEALAWAHQRLLARGERRRILVVVSDGTPMDEATFAANGFDYLDGHLAAVVGHIEQRSPVKLAAIGIGHDVSLFYRHATRIRRVEELGDALASNLLALLDERSHL